MRLQLALNPRGNPSLCQLHPVHNDSNVTGLSDKVVAQLVLLLSQLASNDNNTRSATEAKLNDQWLPAQPAILLAAFAQVARSNSQNAVKVESERTIAPFIPQMLSISIHLAFPFCSASVPMCLRILRSSGLILSFYQVLPSLLIGEATSEHLHLSWIDDGDKEDFNMIAAQALNRLAISLGGKNPLPINFAHVPPMLSDES
ncbi:hypothetical protein BDK51DRAFT_44605 [Blyttiomyces helicus]|uniref:Uncharacterized protein n=1 Tax=Blyttiomyces helicus TaxID=388810 RepID=A0A4V1IS40_9FUNG|nr:hypothetical protein BDK51DRAFT_44605 [Blyttiomyces helicus]|eukprot:RKO92227.1 hypothetical protein BDK51DRAFT_44605 [Blyttiomyces helicus]